MCKLLCSIESHWVISHECYDILFHWPLGCFFQKFIHHQKGPSKPCITGLLCWEMLVTSGFPAQKANIQKVYKIGHPIHGRQSLYWDKARVSCKLGKWAYTTLHTVSMSNIRKNIYMSFVQATFELYCHFRCLQVLYSKLNYITKYWLTQRISKLPCSLKSTEYPINFTGLVDIANAIVYKTEPIFTSLQHGKLS